MVNHPPYSSILTAALSLFPKLKPKGHQFDTMNNIQVNLAAELNTIIISESSNHFQSFYKH
jgi:hypothetical protein